MLSWFKRRSRDPEPRDAAPAAASPEVCEAAKRELEQALACLAAGDLAQAEALARSALAFQHDYADAQLVLGQLCHRRRAFDEAADCYLLASCFAPCHAEPRLQLGLLYLDQGALDEAERTLDEALGLEPRNARVHNAMGAVLIHADRIDEAKHHLDLAVECDPTLADAHSNLGYLLFRDFEEFARGERHVRTALDLAPDDITALSNLTMVLRDRPHAVIELADRLLVRDPSLDGVRLNRGLAHLKLGRFEAGWRDYEARKSTRCNYVVRRMPWPEWDGGDLAGKGIYVHTEQGLGDEIMFASCLPEIVSAADRCVIECSAKLQKIFSRSFGARVVLRPTDDRDVPGLAGGGIHVYSALGSLPRHLRPAADRFPAHRGYLKADPPRVQHWRERLAALPGKLKVGIAWRGGVPSTQRSLRSTRLEQWLPLFRVTGVDFIDLQHIDSAEETRALQQRETVSLHRWADAHEDYDETAALVSALDLVVSVQTAVVHLAGALGKEAWALLPESPEWRYQQSGATMPWYPSVKLVRTPAGGSWDEVIAALAPALAARAAPPGA